MIGKDKNAPPRPSRWFFSGYFAFMAWGLVPLSQDSDDHDLLFSRRGEIAGKFNKGRKQQRAESIAEQLSAKKQQKLANPPSSSARSITSNSTSKVKLIQVLSLNRASDKRDSFKLEEILEKKKESAWRSYIDAREVAKDTGEPSDSARVFVKRNEYEATEKDWAKYVDSMAKGFCHPDDKLIETLISAEKQMVVDLPETNTDSSSAPFSYATPSRAAEKTTVPRFDNISSGSDEDESTAGFPVRNIELVDKGYVAKESQLTGASNSQI